MSNRFTRVQIPVRAKGSWMYSRDIVLRNQGLLVTLLWKVGKGDMALTKMTQRIYRNTQNRPLQQKATISLLNTMFGETFGVTSNRRSGENFLFRSPEVKPDICSCLPPGGGDMVTNLNGCVVARLTACLHHEQLMATISLLWNENFCWNPCWQEKRLGKLAARLRRLRLVDAHLPTLSTLPRLAPPVDPVVSHQVGLKTRHGC